MFINILSPLSSPLSINTPCAVLTAHLIFSPLVLLLYKLLLLSLLENLTPLHQTLFRLTPPPHHPFSLSSCTFLGRQSSLCSPYDIIQCRLQPLYATVQVLAALDSASLDTKQRETVSPSNSASSGGSQCRSLVSVTTQTPPPSWQMWDLIGSSLLHVLCLTLLFVAYSWIELT